MFTQTRVLISGKKTYLLAIAGIITLIVGWSEEQVSTLQAIIGIITALGAISGRAALTKAVEPAKDPARTLDCGGAGNRGNFPGGVGLLLVFALLGVAARVPSAVRADDPPAADTAAATPATNTTALSSNVLAKITAFVEASAGGITNWHFIPFGLYAPGLDNKYGGGLAAFYPVSEFFLAGLRLDYVDGGFYMPSGNATLQYRFQWKFIELTPFGYAGIGVPLSGAKIGDFTVPGHVRDNNGEPTAILGYGVALRVYQTRDLRLDLVIDREKWTGFPDYQYRCGLAIRAQF